MNIDVLEKEELYNKIGIVSFWKSKPVLDCLTYLSGISGFDSQTKPIVVPKILIIKYPQGLEIQWITGFKTVRTGILHNEITAITLEDREQIKVLKDKSVIWRALIGGLLLGPVGAIVGGMSGIG